TEPLRRLVRSAVPAGWGAHPRLWLMACDYVTGRRVAFGREDAPPADLADAAAASCAIPGFYRPVQIGGRRSLDGGVGSTPGPPDGWPSFDEFAAQRWRAA